MTLMAMLMIASRVLALEKPKATSFMPSQEPNAQHASKYRPSQKMKRKTRFKIQAFKRAETHFMRQIWGLHNY